MRGFFAGCFFALECTGFIFFRRKSFSHCCSAARFTFPRLLCAGNGNFVVVRQKSDKGGGVTSKLSPIIAEKEVRLLLVRGAQQKEEEEEEEAMTTIVFFSSLALF